jgi:MAF protein
MVPEPPPQILLASASPRRSELLALTGWSFTTCEAAIDETALPGEPPEDLARRLAAAKAAAAAQSVDGPAWVLAADTVVVDQGAVLGKPEGVDAALAMLRSLQGQRHQVISSLALVRPRTGEQRSEICRSVVPMRSYSLAEAAAYIARGEAWDKAGGYAIQDPLFRPVDVEHMQDCYANVMGLPLCHLVRAMRSLGASPIRDVPQACQQHTHYDCPVYRDILEGRR